MARRRALTWLLMMVTLVATATVAPPARALEDSAGWTQALDRLAARAEAPPSERHAVEVHRATLNRIEDEAKDMRAAAEAALAEAESSRRSAQRPARARRPSRPRWPRSARCWKSARPTPVPASAPRTWR